MRFAVALVFAAALGMGIYALAQAAALTLPDSAFVIGWIGGGLTALVISLFPTKR